MATPLPSPVSPQDPTLPIQFGVPLDGSSLLFFASLLAAIWLVYLFCNEKFAERCIAGTDDDYVYQLLPRQLATHEEYLRGFLFYFGAMAGFVLLMSLIGPKNLGSLGISLPEQISYIVVPLAIAFGLVGAMPIIPGFMELEKRLRNYAHQVAYIPAAARATAERLAAADFDFSSYVGEALLSPQMQGVEPTDFVRSRRSLEHNWARLSSLVYELHSRRDAGLLGPLDGELLRSYEKDLDSIGEKKNSMVAEVRAYRAERAKNPSYTNEDLRHAIRVNLWKLYILLGCAVRLKKRPHDDIDLPLREFGFVLNHAGPKPSNNDLKIVCAAVIAASTLLIEFVAAELGQLHLWAVSPVFPQTFVQPFIDAAATLVPYGAAILTADLMRRRAINAGWWFSSSGPRRVTSSANYVRIAFVCGLAGYAALVLWGLAFQQPTLSALKVEAPNALLAMATGGFFAYHLDNVELQTRPARSWEVGSQAVLTGICGLIAGCASWNLTLGDSSLAIDKIILQTAISTTIGFLLAWYIPEAAVAAQHNPLVEAREERIRMLEAAARRRFDTPEAAVNWLEVQNPTLGYRSPKAAAGDLEGFERAMSLLQGPRALAS